MLVVTMHNIFYPSMQILVFFSNHWLWVCNSGWFPHLWESALQASKHSSCQHVFTSDHRKVLKAFKKKRSLCNTYVIPPLFVCHTHSSFYLVTECTSSAMFTEGFPLLHLVSLRLVLAVPARNLRLWLGCCTDHLSLKMSLLCCLWVIRIPASCLTHTHTYIYTFFFQNIPLCALFKTLRTFSNHNACGVLFQL